jgi:hypothetical protein
MQQKGLSAMNGLEYYQDKAARDERAADLKLRGFPFKKSTVRNCVLSPDAIEDYSGYRSSNGFGGSASTWFSRLYKLEY